MALRLLIIFVVVVLGDGVAAAQAPATQPASSVRRTPPAKSRASTRKRARAYTRGAHCLGFTADGKGGYFILSGRDRKQRRRSVWIAPVGRSAKRAWVDVIKSKSLAASPMVRAVEKAMPDIDAWLGEQSLTPCTRLKRIKQVMKIRFKQGLVVLEKIKNAAGFNLLLRPPNKALRRSYSLLATFVTGKDRILAIYYARKIPSIMVVVERRDGGRVSQDALMMRVDDSELPLTP